jgi:CheY-like chemotaxis protein
MANVLVVDDEQSIRSLLVAILEDEGHSVVQAADGYQALDVLKTQDLDIVILDVMMPGIDGRETYRRIRLMPELEHVPVIMVSAGSFSAPETVHAFLRKPFRLDDFVSTLDHALNA